MKGEAKIPRVRGLCRRRAGPPPLRARAVSPTSYFSHPDAGLAFAGWGVAAEGEAAVEWLGEAWPPDTAGPWLGGFCFDARRNWPGVDDERWLLPEVACLQAGSARYELAFGGPEATVESLGARLDAALTAAPEEAGVSARWSAVPDDGGPYRALVVQALDAIHRRQLRKVVPARVQRLVADSEPALVGVLERLEARFGSCRVFLVPMKDGSAFLGASPEVLVEAQGDRLHIDALAGTAAPEEAAALLTSPKDRSEHDFVVQAIVESLGRAGVAVEAPGLPQLKALANVAHLHTPIQATLPRGGSALDVARQLHPTPAVAGTPRGDAMAWLAAHEGFRRGWYAGAVGLRGPSSLSLCVAVRSARVVGRSAELFVGAGVVEGSTPEGEWAETQAKAGALLAAFGVE